VTPECGTVRRYWRGCKCLDCKEANRVYGLALRRERGIGPPTIRPVADRFWEKVEKIADGCWLWTAGLSQDGYGLFREGPGRTRPAHRWAYEHIVGEIPEGLQLDHLCRVRNCVNPNHLEPVTAAENSRRARVTHCKRGHELTPDNVYWQRSCKTCRKEKGQR
jgi:hypothetical protein